MVSQAKDLEKRTEQLSTRSFYKLFGAVVECSELLQQISPSRRRPWLANVVQEMYEEQNGQCAICQETLDFGAYEVDHIIPICYGGGNERGNLQLACRTCNRSKGAGVDPYDLLRYLEDRYMNL